MKIPLLLLVIASVFTLRLHAENSPIRVSIEQISKSETKDKKKPHDKTQVRSLKIRLDNNSTTAFESLLVKYWFFGHSAGEHAIKELVSGERKAAITARGTEMVESEVVSKSFSEESYDVKSKKKVPATGDKISGYAVRVMQGDKVLAEVLSEPSYKALIDKTGAAAPAPEAKPAAKK
jgi:hypothetical protein